MGMANMPEIASHLGPGLFRRPLTANTRKALNKRSTATLSAGPYCTHALQGSQRMTPGSGGGTVLFGAVDGNNANRIGKPRAASAIALVTLYRILMIPLVVTSLD